MSSKINLQPCEYARKSSIFQDNQLILNKKYKYIKFSIAASDSCEDGASMNYVIKADDNVVYTSKSFTKKDEPFSESSIDISNCNLLTVEFNTDKWGEGQAFMYDAVVFNAE